MKRKYLQTIVKEFYKYTELETGDSFLSCTYISTKDGFWQPAKLSLPANDPNNLNCLVVLNKISGLLSYKNLDLPHTISINELAICHLVDTYVLEEYFVRSELLDIADFNFVLPKVRSEHYVQEEFEDIPLQYTTQVNGELLGFTYQGINYPAPSYSGNPTLFTFDYQHQFPGYKSPGTLSPKLVNPQAISSRKITTSLLQGPKETISKAKSSINKIWFTQLVNSFEFFGLGRDDWQKLLTLLPYEIQKKILWKALDFKQEGTKLFFAEVSNPDGWSLVFCSDNFDWKYYVTAQTPITISSDLKVQVYKTNFTKDGPKFENPQAVLSTFDLTTPQSQNITFTKDGLSRSYTFEITRSSEEYIPEIDLTEQSPPLINGFLEGYNYLFSTTTVILPAGLQIISPATALQKGKGYLPRTTQARNWENSSYNNIALLKNKGNKKATEWLFDLCKLTLGQQYNNTLNKIESGPLDLAPLRLWHLSPLVPGFLASNDSNSTTNIVGHSTQTVWIRLPIHYKRDQKEWQLVRAICELQLTDYVLGYHEFCADYSVAEEAVFKLIEPTIQSLNTIWQSANFTRIDPLLGFLENAIIVLGDIVQAVLYAGEATNTYNEETQQTGPSSAGVYYNELFPFTFGGAGVNFSSFIAQSEIFSAGIYFNELVPIGLQNSGIYYEGFAITSSFNSAGLAYSETASLATFSPAPPDYSDATASLGSFEPLVLWT